MEKRIFVNLLVTETIAHLERWTYNLRFISWTEIFGMKTSESKTLITSYNWRHQTFLKCSHMIIKLCTSFTSSKKL